MARDERIELLGAVPPAWRPFLAAFWPFILGSALVAGGLAAIVIGYLGASGTVHVGLQIPYVVSGGLLGLALVFFGGVLLVVHALNRHARLLRRLVDETRRPETPAQDETSPAPSPNGLVLVPAGATTFHRAGCRLVEGKRPRRLKLATAERRGLTPCTLCGPLVPAAPSA